jgi:hypothetical protein
VCVCVCVCACCVLCVCVCVCVCSADPPGATYLKVDTVYRFQLLALNEAGEGPPTEIVRVRTQQNRTWTACV